MWLDTPDQWDRLIAAIEKAGECGLDTETYGQPDKTSPQHRARIHCWSVGVLSATRSPRGFRRAVGRVLPRAALDYGPIRRLLCDSSVQFWAHNAPHDRHALANEGVEVRGLQDSLQWARVACPGMRDYGLKGMAQWALGYAPRPSFLDMVSYQQVVVHARRHRERGCICGANPCRARSAADWLDDDGVWRPHERVSWSVFTPIARTVPARLAVTDFVPGAVLPPLVWSPTKKKPIAPVWWKGRPLDRLAEWWAYSAADAIQGIELVDWLRGQKQRVLVYPWTRQ